MLSIDDFNYILKRVKRDPNSPAGLSLRAVLLGDKLPGIAARETGIPMVRFLPIYEDAVKIISGMTVTEADGFTADELALANRALAVSRAKETVYTPTTIEFQALDRMHKMNGSVVKAMNGSVDDLPTVGLNTLWSLESNGALTATPLGGPVFQWTLTPLGQRLRDERFK